MEEERMLMELSNAERWMYLNAKLIADKVLKTRDRKALIPKDAYDESLEDDLIALLFYAPKVKEVYKAEEGILLFI